jgi:hypothetical protein
MRKYNQAKSNAFLGEIGAAKRQKQWHMIFLTFKIFIFALQ